MTVAILIALGGPVAWMIASRLDSARADPMHGARYSMLTEFDGAEQSAALSRDGKFVAFLSDRDGPRDIWVAQIGAGDFHNLTQGRAEEVQNDDLRGVDFSPDGALVLFWHRSSSPARGTPAISVLGVPALGGQVRPYLSGAAEVAWSPDGTRAVYHPPSPGDPLFVTEALQQPGRRIYVAPEGIHNHFPVWSPDSRHIYFVRGRPPGETDLWRIDPDGGDLERMTTHDARVSHPTFLDSRTLLYLATDEDGSGPWLHALDVARRTSRRLSTGVERFTSVAASADGRRLVLTTTRRKSSLWRASLEGVEPVSEASRVQTSAHDAHSPRIGRGLLLFVASKGAQDAIWKYSNGEVTELWTATGARLAGAPALSPDQRTIAFTVEGETRATLYLLGIDGGEARTLSESLDVRGSPAWAPHGASIAVAAVADGIPRLFVVPLDGRPPARIVDGHAVDPVWSPDGRFVVYSVAEVGPRFAVKAVTPDGQPRQLPPITLSRGARRLQVVNGGAALVALRGEIGRGDLVLIDLATGVERRLTNLGDEFVVRDFDVSTDGRDLVVDRYVDDTDLVLVDRG